jgi:hypothetical protein
MFHGFLLNVLWHLSLIQHLLQSIFAGLGAEYQGHKGDHGQGFL